MFFDKFDEFDNALNSDPKDTVPEEAQIKTRVHQRYPFFRTARWDFFTGGSGLKTGYVTNISKGGCLLKAYEPIEHRRWLRVFIQDAHTNVCFAQVGRIVRRQDIMESLEPHSDDITLYRYGMEFTHPSYLTRQDDLILALSSTNLTVRSCLNLNKTSSLREGSAE